jgi:general secretion pathway protein D
VLATEQQHQQIQEFLDITLASIKRQVLIQATIAEVQLSDQYQAGIDWSFINQAGKAGLDIISTTLSGVPIGTVSSFIMEYVDPNTDRDEAFRATIRLLDEFGDTTILSSPQIMVLNNQTALLKVVENVVYFEIDSDLTPSTVAGGQPVTSVDTTAKTVPVGIVMAVTPQISSTDEISLNIRPTISRVVDFVNDPNPAIPAGLSNPVPEIEVREMESMLRLTSGQIGVLGGLMQDATNDSDRGLPGVSKKPVLGIPFKTTTKDYIKTELVIFLRPLVIRNPSLEDDLQYYKTFLDPQRHQRDLDRQGDGAL